MYKTTLFTFLIAFFIFDKAWCASDSNIAHIDTIQSSWLSIKLGKGTIEGLQESMKTLKTLLSQPDKVKEVQESMCRIHNQLIAAERRIQEKLTKISVLEARQVRGLSSDFSAMPFIFEDKALQKEIETAQKIIDDCASREETLNKMLDERETYLSQTELGDEFNEYKDSLQQTITLINKLESSQDRIYAFDDYLKSLKSEQARRNNVHQIQGNHTPEPLDTSSSPSEENSSPEAFELVSPPLSHVSYDSSMHDDAMSATTDHGSDTQQSGYPTLDEHGPTSAWKPSWFSNFRHRSNYYQELVDIGDKKNV